MNKRIQVSVSSECDTILTTIALDLGISKSSLCSFILSDHVLKFLQSEEGKSFLIHNRDELINSLQCQYGSHFFS